jgi:hypothetical protein
MIYAINTNDYAKITNKIAKVFGKVAKSDKKVATNNIKNKNGKQRNGASQRTRPSTFAICAKPTRKPKIAKELVLLPSRLDSLVHLESDLKTINTEIANLIAPSSLITFKCTLITHRYSKLI